MAKRTCTVDGCDAPVHGAGWCSKHYQRWWKNGDPLLSKLDRESPWEVRFWRKVDKAGAGGCWLWTSSTRGEGYGKFSGSSVGTDSAHRISYILLVGPIPDGLELDHLCRVRNCVNPDHLEPVTNAENVRRAFAASPRARPTHCKHGHEFTTENTLMEEGGGRRCRICRNVALRDLKRRHSNPALPFQCPDCGQTSPSQRGLTCHWNWVHRGSAA